MMISEFRSLPVYENLLEVKEPKIGMKFLTGTKVVEQKESKDIGDTITYYIINDVKNTGRFSYTMKMEKLTRSMGED